MWAKWIRLGDRDSRLHAVAPMVDVKIWAKRNANSKKQQVMLEDEVTANPFGFIGGASAEAYAFANA